MSDIRVRLQSLFAETAATRLARSAPAALLASGTGIALAGLLGSPAFAATGAGIIIGGIAINFTSSLLERLVMLPLEAETEREHVLEQGLEQHDPAVTQLVAATLTHVGPELAPALPQASRAELIAGLEKAMHNGGAPLQAIAGQYAAALRNAQTDWPALQAALRQTITNVAQTMEATDSGEISRGRQRVEGAAGPVSQVMRVSGQSRITDSSQEAIGGQSGSGAREAQTHPVQQHEHAHLEELLARHTRRLHEREKQAATYGIATPPEIATEIQDLTASIERIERQLRLSS